MATDAKQGIGALTEKEKQTLRLIVRGHDAKSIARALDLSVHTINERLREARRKVAVPSSREAARLLFEAEGGDPPAPPPALPDSVGDTEIGEAVAGDPADSDGASVPGAGQARRLPRITIGVALMTLALAFLALAALPQASTTPAPAPATEAPDATIVAAAQRFLELVDGARWDDSYRATGAAFRKLNTVQVWTAASEQVRARFGATLSRSFLSQQNLPAPPAGYEVVKFRTRFAKQAEAVETVTLEREDGAWRVVGVTVE